MGVKATHFGAFHGDPADRLIVATALVDAAVIVTKDRNISTDDAVTSVW
ncbi:MAG: PIN domain nuclease [Acidobacteria bacterium]|nr:MAG: PIN domain nuclease [Acidobacteriota bacterium]